MLVTLDKDFGELAVARGLPHVGIIRIADVRLHQQVRCLLQCIERHHEALRSGALVTVSPSRMRVRPQEVEPDQEPP